MSKRPSRSHKAPAPSQLMLQVAKAIDTRRLSLRAAAEAIGVTVVTLQNHLRGEHVRSDSINKYQDWLVGRSAKRQVFSFPRRTSDADVHPIEAFPEKLPTAPHTPWFVVDIFSGCGGLSLGFDLLGDGQYFRTILALDNQPAPIAVFNRNSEALGHKGPPIGRRVDLTEFLNEAEFLSFYIHHTAKVLEDDTTRQRLLRLSNAAFGHFLQSISATDAEYVEELSRARSAAEWRAACDGLDRQALTQTSVIGFHDQLRLPRSGTKAPTMPVVLWNDAVGTTARNPKAPGPSFVADAEREWNAAVASLEEKREASGRGQLSASARRVRAFVDFVRSPAFMPIRRIWVKWRAKRNALRTELFTNARFAREVSELYLATYPVSVLVGGPPCQGFSRIGRGKIRSLRDALVHVHGDSKVGDTRNLLFLQYVMVLGALRPTVFVFENVAHFQSTVRAEDGEFQATDVLADAIANISDGAVKYVVSSSVIDASRHGIPQARQRYFMCGVLDVAGATSKRSLPQIAEGCLALPRSGDVPLAAALAGLPEPEFIGGDEGSGEDAMERTVGVNGAIAAGTSAVRRYTDWVRQSPPASKNPPDRTDAHAARTARSDDAAFFSLMGPGKRWMDYRADDSVTVSDIQRLLDGLLALPATAMRELCDNVRKRRKEFPDAGQIEELRRRIDGSLPIRLMLEQIGAKLEGHHHLLADSYLTKRDGNHGDWVARMDGSRPSKTMVSHMGKDTYAFIHPASPRTLSVREAARIQTFPDWFLFGASALTDAFKMIGNAVPPMLSHAIAGRIASALARVNSDVVDSVSAVGRKA